MIHLSRETSACSACQDEPTLVAITQEGAVLSKQVLQATLKLLAGFHNSGSALEWREERNALFPLSACVSLGINSNLRNFQKLVLGINDPGKELEFRNALALINDSLANLLPAWFKLAAEYGHTYPDSVATDNTFPPTSSSSIFSKQRDIRARI